MAKLFIKSLVMTVGLVSVPALAGAPLAPILPLNLNIGQIPLLDQALREDNPNGWRLGSDADAERVTAEIKEGLSDLKKAQGLRQNEIVGRVFEDYIQLAGYLADVASGRIGNNSNPARTEQNLTSTRTQAITWGESYISRLKNAGAKARVQYLVASQRFLLNHETVSLNSKSLSGSLKTKAQLLAALAGHDIGSLRYLLPSLNGDAALVAHLSLAQSEKNYRKDLASASQDLNRLSPKERNDVIKQVLAIWRAHEGSAANWNQSPIDTATLADSDIGLALAERSAISDWQSGKADRAIQKYSVLANQTLSLPANSELQARLLMLHEALYVMSGNSEPYEQAILNVRQNSKNQSLVANARARHHNLVTAEINRAKQPNTPDGKRQNAIAITRRYLALQPSSNEIESLTADMALIYLAAKSNHEAVMLYLDLAHKIAPQKKRAYLALAAQAQSSLANWPLTAPWVNTVTAGDNVQRESLVAIYKELAATATSRGVDWGIAAQIGLLEISLGQADQAYALWTADLKMNGQAAHARQAAGYMLNAYEQSKRWEDLETIARLCLANKIFPAFNGRNLAPRELLAEALINGGKAALAASHFAVAVKKLNEFVTAYPAVANRDEGLFYLAAAHHGNHEHPQSIDRLVELCDSYPNSSFHRQALLNGQSWTIPMAFEESAIYFGSSFLNRYPNDPQVSTVRASLIQLYRGRGLYAQAEELLKEVTRDSKRSSAEHAQSWEDYMEIAARTGSDDNALAAANTVLNAAESPINARALALQTTARYYGEKSDLAQVTNIEQALSRLDAASAGVSEALGETRFILAENLAQKVVMDAQVISLDDPNVALMKYWNQYSQSKAAYEKVCQGNDNSFCGPALYQLARLSEKAIDELNDLSIARTLDGSIVRRFDNRKSSIMNAMTKNSQDADNRAVAIVNQGFTSPQWTQSILWHNAKDWNLDREGNNLSGGYVEWPAKQAGAGLIVQKTGSGAIAFGQKDRSYWASLRNAANGNTKMFALLANGEWEAAATQARAVLRRQPRDFSGLRILASALAVGKQYELAAYYANLLDKYYPGSPEVNNLKGLSLVMTSDNRMVFIKRALALFSDDFSAGASVASGLNLGELYLQLGNATAASRAFDDVSNRCNHCTQAMMGRGIAFARVGRFKEASTTFEQVLAQSPNYGEAIYRLALVYRNGFKNDGRAIELLQKLVADDSQEATLHKRAGSALRSLQSEAEVGNAAPELAIEHKKGVAEKSVVSQESDDE